jgi:hypothetical protein
MRGSAPRLNHPPTLPEFLSAKLCLAEWLAATSLLPHFQPAFLTYFAK